MSHAQKVSLLPLLVISFVDLLAMESRPYGMPEIKPLYVQDEDGKFVLRPQSSTSAASSSPSLLSSFTRTFNDEDERTDLLLSLKYAPGPVQQIIDHLKDPTLFKQPKYNAAYFVGVPGAGKTSAALVIGLLMHQHSTPWTVCFVNGSDILGKYRNKGLETMRKLFAQIKEHQRPVLLIFDEFNQLMENYNSEHHDTGPLSKAIWKFLDDPDQKSSQFFLVATMNQDDKLPQPMKDRMLLRRVLFEPADDVGIKADVFRSKIVNDTTTLTEEGEAYVRECARMPGLTWRNLSEIAMMASIESTQDSKGATKVIDKKHLTRVVSRYIQSKHDMRYDRAEESSEDRMERFHHEMLSQQKWFFAIGTVLTVSSFLASMAVSLNK